jgi:hypothetical protein
VSTDRSGPTRLLEAARNLSRFHQEHERFYASAPLESAVRLQRHARALQALADRWTTVQPSDRTPMSPFEGAEDLNSETATALDGVLFLEGEGTPAEITTLIGELHDDAERFAASGTWLADAMRASWGVAAAMLEVDGLADVMGERHRIIANDWLAAHMQSLIATLLARGAEMLEHIDFTPASVRADLAGSRLTPRRLFSAAEVISRAADLCCESAQQVHDNERRWRVTHQRIDDVLKDLTARGEGRSGPPEPEEA